MQYAMWDNVDGSVVIRRPVLNYSVSYDLVPLADVAGKTRQCLMTLSTQRPTA